MRQAIFAGLILLSPCTVSAHDAWGVANPDLADGDEIQRALQEVVVQQGDQNARWVAERGLVWKPGSKLNGCFIGGADAERKRVEKVTEEMLVSSGANISIEFSLTGECSEKTGKQEVRVSFKDGCCAAYVGRTSIAPSIIGKPSVYLQGSPGDSTIRHEILHALGFLHEHQQPDSPCGDEFKVKEMAATWGWSEDKVKHNVGTLIRNSKKYAWGIYDEDSIMKYYFQPKFLNGGVSSPCYTVRNTDLSDGDVEGLLLMYPPATAQAGGDRAAGLAVLDLSGAPDTAASDITEMLRYGE